MTLDSASAHAPVRPSPALWPDYRLAGMGLGEYVRGVAVALGLDPAANWWTCNSSVEAYIPLNASLSDHPDHDLSLSWNETHGWSTTLEQAGRIVRAVAWLPGAVLPPAAEVVDFVERVLAGTFTPDDTKAEGAEPDVIVKLSELRPSAITIEAVR